MTAFLSSGARRVVLALAAGFTAAALGAFAVSCVTVDPDIKTTDQVEDWRDEIIYQIMVDRFEDGDPNNNFNVDLRKEASYHGGDWQGIIDRLDYIEALGVTALWISPVVNNVESDAGFGSYHGYWTQDFVGVNPHFGDLTKLQDLVRACHRRGIKVILDVVTNHIGQLFYYDINRNGQPDIVFFGGGGPGHGSRTADYDSDLRRASEWDPDYDRRGVQGFTALGENGLAPVVWVEMPELNRVRPNPPEFANPDWYNRRGRVTVWEQTRTSAIACDSQPNCDGRAQCLDEGRCDFSCQDGFCRPTFEYVREQEIYGDFPGGLKDLATERADVREALIRVFQYWIRVADFDGFRIDTLKHQEHEFFDVFAPAIRRYAKSRGKHNFFMFGEAFDGSDALLGSYTHGEGVDSLFYFSAKYQVFDDVFGRGVAPRKVQQLFDERGAPDTQGRPRYNDQPKPDGPRNRTDYNAALAACRSGGGDVPTCEAEANRVAGQSSQQLMVHFIDNHDVPRFLFDFPDVGKLRRALVYLLTADGVPCIYYGTEQDFRGGPDPSNREDMWSSGWRTDGETFRHMQRLIQLRKAHLPLRRGEMVFRWASEHMGEESDAGLLAFERVHGDARVLVLINTQDARGTRTRLGDTAMATGFGGGVELRDVLNEGQSFRTQADGTLDIEIPPGGARILLP